MAAAQGDQLEDIKRLLMLLLLKLGATSEEMGLALQVDSSVVRKMMPGRQVRRIVTTPEA